MEPKTSFMVRGRRSVLIPTVRRPSVMMMAPPPESPVHTNKKERGMILNKLSQTQSRIFKILEDYEERKMIDDADLDELRRSADMNLMEMSMHSSIHEGTNTSQRELQSLKDSLKRQFNDFIKDDYTVSAEGIPSSEGFTSAMNTANCHIKELEVINNRILELAKSKDLPQLAQISGSTADKQYSNKSEQENKLLKMYTTEAMKASKLKKLINDQDNELKQLRTSYTVLSEKSKKEHERLKDTSASLSEANQIIAQLRAKLNSTESMYKRQSQCTYQFIKHAEPVVTATEPSTLTLIIPQVDDPVLENDEIKDKIDHEKDKDDKIEKKQVTKKFAEKKSKIMEKQLTTMEELIVHSSNQVKVSLKNKSELIVQLNLDILQLCHGMYSCMNEAVESIIYLLGVKDAENLLSLLQAATATWESKTRSCKESMSEYLGGLIDSTEKDAAQLSIELEDFVQKKFKAFGRLLVKDFKECAVEIQNWLLKATVEIQGAIQSTLDEYHKQLEGIEEQRSCELHDTAKKIITGSSELQKIMGGLNMQCGNNFLALKDHVKELLDGLKKPQSETYDATVRSILQSQEKIFSIVNSLRSSISGQLRKKHKINFCSSSWRSRSFNQKPTRRMSVANIHNINEKPSDSNVNHNKDLSSVSMVASRSVRRPSIQSPQISHPSLATTHAKNHSLQRADDSSNNSRVDDVPVQNTSSIPVRNHNLQRADSSNSSQVDDVPVQNTSSIPVRNLETYSHSANSYSERQGKSYQPSDRLRYAQVEKKLIAPQATITPSKLSVIEFTSQPRPRTYPRQPQPFHKTTKQERMQRYYKHIQAKYSGRTSLEPPAEPQCRPNSSMSIPSRSSAGNTKGNNLDFMHVMTISTPKNPLQRIGNFSYPRKAWQSNAPTVYNDAHDYHPGHFLPEAPESHKYHHKFSGKSLPKWNQLYRAYQGSS